MGLSVTYSTVMEEFTLNKLDHTVVEEITELLPSVQLVKAQEPLFCQGIVAAKQWKHT